MIGLKKKCRYLSYPGKKIQNKITMSNKSINLTDTLYQYLLAAALLLDTGGVATLVGDPPKLMIGSSAGIDFNTFFIHMGPPVTIAWLTILFAMKYLFPKELSNKHTLEFESKAR